MVFKVGKDAFEQGAVALALLPLCREEPFIVLIYQHHSLRVENVADVQKDGAKADSGIFIIVDGQLEALLKIPQLRFQAAQHGAGLGIVHTREREVENGIGLPLRFEVPDSQPLKEVFPALKISFEGTDEQTLSETPRTRQEVLPPLRDEPIQIRSFVRIEVSPCADCFEILDADGQ